MGDAADDAERRADEAGENTETLLEKFYGVVDGYYYGSQDFCEIEKALEAYENIFKAVNSDSLARDGWEMIEVAMRGDS